MLSDRFDPRYFERDVLFRYYAGWAGLDHSRPSPATYLDRSGILRTAAPDVPRVTWADLDGDGEPEPYLLLEPARTNVLFDSCRLPDTGSAWFGSSGWTIAPAASVIDGETAWRHTNDGGGARSRYQLQGTLTGSPETAWVLIESSDAETTDLRITDATLGVVHQVRLHWATGEVERVDGYDPAGTHGAIRLDHAGPNGGRLYLLWLTATGTAGNGRDVRLYATGVGANTHTVIIHHVQLEEAAAPSSVIVTGPDAGATRVGDVAMMTRVPPLQALTICERFVEGGTTLDNLPSARLRWKIGSSEIGVGPSLDVFATSVGSRAYRLAFRHPAGQVLTPSNGLPRPEIGQTVEHLAAVWWEGDTLHLQLDQSIDGGSVETAQASQVGRPMPAAWAEDVAYHTAGVSGISGGRTWLRDWVWLRGSHWTMDAVRRVLPW